MESYDRLRAFISANIHGGCKILSQGDACTCALCDLDRLRADVLKVHKKIMEDSNALRTEAMGYAKVGDFQKAYELSILSRGVERACSILLTIDDGY